MVQSIHVKKPPISSLQQPSSNPELMDPTASLNSLSSTQFLTPGWGVLGLEAAIVDQQGERRETIWRYGDEGENLRYHQKESEEGEESA